MSGLPRPEAKKAGCGYDVRVEAEEGGTEMAGGMLWPQETWTLTHWTDRLLVHILVNLVLKHEENGFRPSLNR